MRIALCALVSAALVIAGIPAHAQIRTLRVAVVNTPDVLLDELIPTFERITGYDVTLEIGEDAFAVARAGRADLVIAHYGHADTRAFMEEGLGRWPRMVFSNQAALVGPSTDPAGIRGLTDAATAIDMAAQRGAYSLWGIVPFMRFLEQRRQQGRPVAMEALVLRDPLFQRVMVSIVVNPSRIRGVDEAGAAAFERYLFDPSTQARHSPVPAPRAHGTDVVAGGTE